MNNELNSQILTINDNVCRHIKNIKFGNRGEESQDILAQLRNFVEAIMVKTYYFDNNIKLSEYNYEEIQKSISYVQSKSKYKFLNDFHDLLQVSESHYTVNYDGSERLMLKYMEYLIKIKKYSINKFGLKILYNLSEFPLNLDKTTQKYYLKIVEKIKNHNNKELKSNGKFYIQKEKPFFIDENTYYEITFVPANDYVNKFDRVIAFSDFKIVTNYAVELAFVQEYISYFGIDTPILIITKWKSSIRDCEYKNFTFLVTGESHFLRNKEKERISNVITHTGFNLLEIVTASDDIFNKFIAYVTANTVNNSFTFAEVLKKCRKIILSQSPGENLLRYLLYNMNNRIIKNQISYENCNKLSQLYAKYGCILFDNLPLNFSLVNHNPKIMDLFYCINLKDRQDEFLARKVKNNSEEHRILFTSLKDLIDFGNKEEILKLIKSYNEKIWSKIEDDNKLTVYCDCLCISKYVKDTCYIINKLENMTKNGVKNYSNFVKSWLKSNNGNNVDSENKANILKNMFVNSRVALIYGSAGTGKSYLMNHVAQLWDKEDKLFLAQTNPAINNLKSKITASNSTFLTINKYLNSKDDVFYDLLIIDECSTVSNCLMRKIIEKSQYYLLILVGDSFQIQSIRFGNWFSMAKNLLNKNSIYELKETYRTKNEGLKLLWARVRNMDSKVLESLVKGSYSTNLNKNIFEHTDNDEIVLCLNYDGLYGVNNVNRLLQQSNKNKPISWELNNYKIGDPVLFNDSPNLSPLIYNNLKGKICDIRILNGGTELEQIQFDIEVNAVFNEIDTYNSGFTLVKEPSLGKSIIRFAVNREKNIDNDTDYVNNTTIPFEIAYAISIHKAQGLEYNSVKIIITDEIGEMITHSIFYTAITRAKKQLKIFWSPEIENRILKTIKPYERKKDIHLIKNIL
ncbi:ATP-dependent RecD-like DNA helicase [Lactobacillus sp. ESL0731]|uniref:ATP-dependent DNA helicase n=1 Tax=unclassified Lactobacillus TaxID=2620435 RepID=UPI0023F8E25B|nr:MULTISPECIES: ATP-dependent RecD-like DNA helicase [unclassified Lactobacillus]WEV51601.1 ATP-dependent RecD-like DNA helicase [Lactobacillus sp. ESL0700]WEV62730.1 ATP-dependent RecD-like DNA helicase [Lactobacillus sp. ESL0731]